MTISFHAARVDFSDSGVVGDEALATVYPTTPNATALDDRAIMVIAAVGFDAGVSPDEAPTDPLITRPNSDWVPIRTDLGVDGKLAEFGAGDNGFHDIWVYGWVNPSIDSIVETLQWQFNTNENQGYYTVAAQQTFAGGFVTVQNLRDAVTDDQSDEWDSLAAGVPDELFISDGSTWVMSSFGAMTALNDPTSEVPDPLWTTVDGPNGLGEIATGAGQTNKWGNYNLSAGGLPSAALVHEYIISDDDLGVRLQFAWDTVDIHGVFFRCRWLYEPGEGDYWGILVS